MEATRDDYRRIALSVVAVLTLFAVVIVVVLVNRPRTPFEWEQAHAEAMNPKGVVVEITTAGNRREFRESAPISVFARFSSTIPYRYKIEIAEGMSVSAVEELHISNLTSSQPVQLRWPGIVCCDSRLVGLNDQPYTRPTVPQQLSPGEYEIYVTSRRVFTWDAGQKEYTPSSFQVASNLLKIRVLPDPGVRPHR